MLPNNRMNALRLACGYVLLSSLTVCAAEPKAPYETQSLHGKVLWTADALKDRYGIESDPDSAQTSVSLATPAGEVYPIVKDVLGRGFLLDPRLRNRDMELLVRRYEGSPFIQIIRVYTLKQGRKYVVDYWCDICAIQMFELKECECCQGPIRLREELAQEERSKQGVKKK
jgi:hypothetical protein